MESANSGHGAARGGPPAPAAGGGGGAGGDGSNNGKPAINTPESDTSTTPRQVSREPSVTQSQSNSAQASRDSSPIRPNPPRINSRNTTRSRKNSTSAEFSPSRNPSTTSHPISTVPSAASVQRALSAVNRPQLPPPLASDSAVDVSKQDRQLSTPASGESTPQWPKSPRLTSPPPPVLGSRAPALTPRRTDHENSLLVPDRPATTSTPNLPASIARAERDIEEGSTRGVMRLGGRGVSGSGQTLETVQESSMPATPALGVADRTASNTRTADGTHPERIEENPMDSSFSSVRSTESGSESGGNKAPKKDGKDTQKPPPAAQKPHAVLPKKSFTTLSTGRGKGSEGSVRNMTVETETVSSIPQVALAGVGEFRNQGRSDPSGSLRLKPSTETIRPKKEKKKTVRKAPSLNAGTGGYSSYQNFNSLRHHHHPFSRPDTPNSQMTRFPGTLVEEQSDSTSNNLTLHPPQPHLPRRMASDSSFFTSLTSRHTPNMKLTLGRGTTASSKADIFEAKVATAVDEANSSDSDETFVYESNPPEPASRPSRYHSRTPSATSTASAYDNYASRKQGLIDGSHSMTGKRSMKFRSNYTHLDDDGSNQGTVRGGRSNGHQPNRHPIGRYGRNGGHQSLFDSDSPFINTHVNKSPHSPVVSGTRISSRPGTPKNTHHLRSPSGLNSPMKHYEVSADDIDGEGADDERTPLVGSNRYYRNRNGRRPNTGASMRQIEYLEQRDRRWIARWGPCALVTFIIFLILGGAIAFVFGLTKPLDNVYVKSIENVLASEQELMLDLHVHATNPNLFSIIVNDIDVNIFAKSRYVGTDQWWRDWGSKLHYDTTNGIDEGNDPIQDPEGDAQTMLLGRIFEFDSPLIFDASPINRRSHSSMGEVRLARPGNSTEEGGSARWERVLQHPFEIIVRGVIKYELLLSSHTTSASIGASMKVNPESNGEQSTESHAGSIKISRILKIPSDSTTRQKTAIRRALEFAA